MFTDKMCPKCNDTGATTKSAENGYLDCTEPGCDAATLRAFLDRQLFLRRPGGQANATNPARDWMAFRLGYETALHDVRTKFTHNPEKNHGQS